jgi:hypothetical protein
MAMGAGEARGEAFGLASGEAIGLAIGEAVGLAVGEAFGLAISEAFGLAGGEAFGLASGEAFGLASGEAIGLASGGAVVGGLGAGRRVSARKATRAWSRLLWSARTREPYAAWRGSAGAETEKLGICSRAERWAIASQRIELTRSPAAAVLTMEHCGSQSEEEQLEWTAASRAEISAVGLGQGIEMTKTRRGLVLANN